MENAVFTSVHSFSVIGKNNIVAIFFLVDNSQERVLFKRNQLHYCPRSSSNPSRPSLCSNLNRYQPFCAIGLSSSFEGDSCLG